MPRALWPAFALWSIGYSHWPSPCLDSHSPYRFSHRRAEVYSQKRRCLCRQGTPAACPTVSHTARHCRALPACRCLESLSDHTVHRLAASLHYQMSQGRAFTRCPKAGLSLDPADACSPAGGGGAAGRVGRAQERAQQGLRAAVGGGGRRPPRHARQRRRHRRCHVSAWRRGCEFSPALWWLTGSRSASLTRAYAYRVLRRFRDAAIIVLAADNGYGQSERALHTEECTAQRAAQRAAYMRRATCSLNSVQRATYTARSRAQCVTRHEGARARVGRRKSAAALLSAYADALGR